jgi:hypothetical protein
MAGASGYVPVRAVSGSARYPPRSKCLTAAARRQSHVAIGVGGSLKVQPVKRRLLSAADGPLVHGMVAGLAPELRGGRRAILVALQGCLCCQMLHSAWTGDRRAARMAGSSPAAAPMTTAAARPPAQAPGGMTAASLCPRA